MKSAAKESQVRSWVETGSLNMLELPVNGNHAEWRAAWRIYSSLKAGFNRLTTACSWITKTQNTWSKTVSRSLSAEIDEWKQFTQNLGKMRDRCNSSEKSIRQRTDFSTSSSKIWDNHSSGCTSNEILVDNTTEAEKIIFPIVVSFEKVSLIRTYFSECREFVEHWIIGIRYSLIWFGLIADPLKTFIMGAEKIIFLLFLFHLRKCLKLGTLMSHIRTYLSKCGKSIEHEPLAFATR